MSADLRTLEQQASLLMDAGEDSPHGMTVCRQRGEVVCGINSIEEKILSGQNENCRVYSVADKLSVAWLTF